MLETRIARVNETRRRVLDFLDDVSEKQSAFKPAPESWCLQEITEHLALAEEIGVLFIWRAIETPWDGEHPHRGLSIEEVVEKTWETKVEAPEPARPRFGGPLAYWCARLAGAETMLDELLWPRWSALWRFSPRAHAVTTFPVGSRSGSEASSPVPAPETCARPCPSPPPHRSTDLQWARRSNPMPP